MSARRSTSLRRNSKYPFIRRALKKRYDKATLARIMMLAEGHYAVLARQCAGASDGEWRHLTGTILPVCAVYKALMNVDAPHARAVTHEAVIGLCRTVNRMLRVILLLPGMADLFMRLLPKLALSLFGRECGFDYENYHADETALTMDVTICPYCHYAMLLGCECLIPTFCESDFATYGDLPGIRFERTATLGTGGKKCDFRFARE